MRTGGTAGPRSFALTDSPTAVGVEATRRACRNALQEGRLVRSDSSLKRASLAVERRQITPTVDACQAVVTRGIMLSVAGLVEPPVSDADAVHAIEGVAAADAVVACLALARTGFATARQTDEFFSTLRCVDAVVAAHLTETCRRGRDGLRFEKVREPRSRARAADAGPQLPLELGVVLQQIHRAGDACRPPEEKFPQNVGLAGRRGLVTFGVRRGVGAQRHSSRRAQICATSSAPRRSRASVLGPASVVRTGASEIVVASRDVIGEDAHTSHDAGSLDGACVAS